MYDRNNLIEFLLQPTSYPHQFQEVQHLQTHISHVFIVGSLVYKIKKPVNFGFLDFSTLDKRKYFCEKEVELNSRLCDAYLGVQRISIKNGEFTFGTGDEIIEFAVKMERLPDEYFLTWLLKQEKLKESDFLRVIEKLSNFYSKQPAQKFIDEFGKAEKVKVSIDENFSLSEQFIGKTLSSPIFDAIRCYNDQFFEKNHALFDKRIQAGFIKDCHGDLRLEHINLSPQKVCIYDCIEFNKRFRFIDIASDIAFLAMDLDFHGYREYAKLLVDQLAKRVGDTSISFIIDFYKCYRAYVRGKVETISSNDPGISEEDRELSASRAKKYFHLALRYALFGSSPGLVVLFGLVGSGKSTVAQALSREIDCCVISSDVVRKEIMGLEPTDRQYVEHEEGIYSEEVTERTYDELIMRGIQEVVNEKTVILDATFSQRKFRDRTCQKAQFLEVPCYFIETRTSVETIKERLLAREKEEKSVSDGRREIFETLRNEFEETVDIPRNQHIVVNTSNSLVETVRNALREMIRMQF